MALPHEVIIPEVKKWCHTEVELQKLSYTWTIANFSCCPQKVGGALQSETFSMETNTEKSEWCLKLYPKGQDSGYSYSSNNIVPIELHLISCSKSEITVKFQCNILNGRTNNGYMLHTFHPGTQHSIMKMTKNELVELNDSSTANDKLTIVCDLCIVGETVRSSGEMNFKEPECTLSKDYGLLFENQTFSDVTLSVRGHKFRVHKTVLAARSRVFQAMFEHKMDERKSGRVDITDIDHVVMQELLKFMYTGKVSNDILDEMAADLLTAADKYALEGLKMKCQQTLCKNISVDNSVQILILADLLSLTQLKSYAINFINRHMAAVMETRDWENMRETRPQLIVEAYYALKPEKRIGESSSEQLTKKRKTSS